MVSCVTVPVDGLEVQTASPPERCVLNAISLPSGDQAGSLMNALTEMLSGRSSRCSLPFDRIMVGLYGSGAP